MQFPNQILSEVIAPNTATFSPGHNVIGLGADLPPELVAAGYSAAMVFYSTIWNPANTFPTMKFMFIGTNGGGIIIGYGYSNNPSTTPTATIVAMEAIGLINNGSGVGTSIHAIRSSAGLNLVDITQYSAGEAYQSWYDAAGNRFWEMSIDSSIQGLQASFGNARGYDNWRACSLQSGWTATSVSGTRTGLYVRRFPDGTVRLQGTIAPGTTAANTVVALLPNDLLGDASYNPSATVMTMCWSNNAGFYTMIFVAGNQVLVYLPAPGTQVEIDMSWSVR